jgi:hypothetical protein
MKEAQGFKEVEHVRLVAIPPESWHLLSFPAYQRKATPHKVKDIAAGLRDGYQPAPIIVYRNGEAYRIVDGGHRFSAYRLNLESYGLAADIPALVYDEEAIDQNQTFVLENNKLRMDPTAIIRADNRRRCCEIIRYLGEEDGPFPGIRNIADFPIRPLSIVKAALILHAQGEELDINRLAYYSVSRALDALERITGEQGGNDFWVDCAIPFLHYELELWGHEGRHLVNFGVLGFAYFLAKNRKRFFDKKGNLVIKTTRTHVSEKRGSREIESKDDRSDFAKLAKLRNRWNELGDQLHIEAPRDPVRVAYEINLAFWRNRPKSQRLWRPEMSL